ncbi:MAG: VanZ family protein [Bacillota bacterium]|nr:VanZ family protein [Bacillota bacterium]
MKSLILNKKTIILLFITILWCCIIFWFSAQPAGTSTEMSSSVSKTLLDLFDKLFKGNTPHFITGVVLNGDHYVRKSGHAIEYFILGILVLNLLRQFKIKRYGIWAILLSTLYASSDEFHQLFVPGRAAMISDVILDTTAAAVGIIIVYLLFYKKGRLKGNT